MALRQMGIARMGNYRPKFDAVNQGGKTGRPKLLHNGTGHGLTGGGGLNAKGTGGGIKVNSAMKPMQRQLRKSKYAANKFNAMKINERDKNRHKRAELKTRTTGGTRMNPHPVGNFMYGHNQWGSINAQGKVDWTGQAPQKGRPIIGFQQALPWLQRTPHMRQVAQQYLSRRAVPPAWYVDPLYTRQKAVAKLIQDREMADISHNRSQTQFDYTNSLRDLKTDYDENLGQTNSAIGSNNIAGSGVAAAQLGKLAEALGVAEMQNQRQMELTNNQLDAQKLLSENAYNTTLTAEQGVAKERWQATHQGQKPPTKPKAILGHAIRYNEHGVPMTANQAKPKFKSFKSFKNAQGQIVRKK